MAKLVCAQPKFRMLVANIDGAGDPSRGRNPSKLRQAFEVQNFVEVAGQGPDTKIRARAAPGLSSARGLRTYTTDPAFPAPSGCTITVVDNTFTYAAKLYLGPYVLVSGVDYTVGGAVGATATNLAAAIDALPGFSASAVGAVITVTGPLGEVGNELRFSAVYSGSVQNLTLSPTTGFMANGEPFLGPPLILN